MSLGNLLLIPGLGAQPSLLDSFSGAAAAYSVRKLRAQYGGSCVRIRRSTDNAEFDIGFMNGLVDTGLILAIVGSGSAFITTIYDQTGNGNHLVQATALAQPIIVNTGAIVTKNGKSAIDFTTSNWMQSTITGLSDATNLSNFAVLTPAAAAVADGTTLHILSFASGGADSANRGLSIGNIQTSVISGEKLGAYFSSATVAAGRLGSTSYDHSAGQQYVYSSFALATGTTVFKNASSVTFNLASSMTTATNTSPANDGSALSTFRLNSIDNVSGVANQTFQESIIYLSDQSANRTGIESAINFFYSVY